jgi:AcrR family transcriptional regulator
MASDELRVRIITAALELAADHPVLSVSLGAIATRAGISLSELRIRYESRLAILEDFAALIDEQMLAGGHAEAGEPARERLLDVMMRRFDALVPYRAGLKGIRKAAMRDPLFAATLNHIAVGSQKWTLAVAGLEPTGPFAPMRSLARAEALVLVTASVLPVFLEDMGEGLPKTMAALDASLKRLDRVARAVTRVESMVDRMCETRPKWNRGGSGKSGLEMDSSGPGGGPRPSGVYAKGDAPDEPVTEAGAAPELDLDPVAVAEDIATAKPKAKRKPPAIS